MSLRTLADEWAEKARELADHPMSAAARKHAAHQATNIPNLRERAGTSHSDRMLGDCIARLMRHFWSMGEGERAQCAAKALRALADALIAPDTFVDPRRPRQKEEPSPEQDPYNPGVRDG